MKTFPTLNLKHSWPQAFLIRSIHAMHYSPASAGWLSGVGLVWFATEGLRRLKNGGQAGWIVTESTGLTLAHSHYRQNSVSVVGRCWLADSQGHLLTARNCHNLFPCGPWVVHGIYACLFPVKKNKCIHCFSCDPLGTILYVYPTQEMIWKT